jgi:hypothetical protein
MMVARLEPAVGLCQTVVSVVRLRGHHAHGTDELEQGRGHHLDEEASCRSSVFESACQCIIAVM